jgi:hypothetical protein
VGYGLDGRGIGGSIPGMGKTVVFFTELRPVLGFTYPSMQWVPGALPLRREADHSPPSSGEVMNGGAIPPLLTRLHGVVLN